MNSGKAWPSNVEGNSDLSYNSIKVLLKIFTALVKLCELIIERATTIENTEKSGSE